MFIRHKTGERFGNPLSKPQTHNIYILRQCTDIAYRLNVIRNTLNSHMLSSQTSCLSVKAHHDFLMVPNFACK
jgi:hypothetical protein